MEKYEKFRKLKQFRWYKLKSMLKKVTAFVLVFLLTMGIFPAREVEAVGYLKDGIKVPYKVLNDGTIRIGPVTHEMVKNEHDTVYIISCTLEDDPRYKRMYYYYLSASKSFVYNLPLDMVRNGLPEGNYKVDIDL